MGKMLGLLDMREGMNVLEVGAGAGVADCWPLHQRPSTSLSRIATIRRNGSRGEPPGGDPKVLTGTAPPWDGTIWVYGESEP
jgi:hypothetical protein